MSLLISEIEKFLSSNALTIHNHKAVMADIADRFELAEGGQAIMRKQTRQVLEGNLQFQMKKLLVPHVNDKSFGKFVSQFKPAPVSDEEKGKTFELIKRSGLVFADKKAESYLLNNFIANGDKINRYDPQTGMVSDDSFSVDEVIGRVAPSAIDQNATYLNKLRKSAEIRQEAAFLATKPEEVDKITGLLHAERFPAFNSIDEARFIQQRADLQAKSMAHAGFIDKNDLSLQEMNAVQIRTNLFVKQLNDLPKYGD